MTLYLIQSHLTAQSANSAVALAVLAYSSSSISNFSNSAVLSHLPSFVSLFHMQQYLLPMGNVAGIIDTKSNSKDDVDAGDDVDGDAPEMEEAYEVNEGEDDGEEDDDTKADAALEE